ncbi:MAG: class I SAM-dependent methyltransferase [Betaproteobacteria bacterium]|nr:class I SAM-dependent methyltransferase [Betaproteobacteria bacterium]
MTQPESSPVVPSVDPTGLPSGAFPIDVPGITKGQPVSQRPDWRAHIGLGLLKRLAIGRLHLTLPNGQTSCIEGSQDPHAIEADLTLVRWAALSKAVARGDIGFGESYMEGDWSSRDLPSLLTLLARNRQAIAPALYGNRLLLWADRLQHLFRGNTKRQSKKNIQAHYDLGNDFYRLWLDETMTYSSAVFDQQGAWGQPVDLVAGQKAKIKRALMEVADGQNWSDTSELLEIGCGWGGLAVERLKSLPGRHLGITLSPAQKAWADALLDAHGLKSRCDIALQDYRDTTGQFDGIVSIEMIEAVGQSYWPAYFQTLRDRLKPGGRAVVQAILIDEELFRRYRDGTDFIQKYIFPGGMLLTRSEIARQAKDSGLICLREFSFGQDYGRTLREWLGRFDSVRGELQRQGMDDRFIAMWRFYLAYCEAGFRCGDLDVVQVTLGHATA